MTCLPNNYRKGFTLAELMIVISIIAIIQAISIPNLLRARASANEASAISSLRTIVSSQAMYFESDLENDGNYDYATTLQELSKLKLIDDILGTGVKSGYYFQMEAINLPDHNESRLIVFAEPIDEDEDEDEDDSSTSELETITFKRGLYLRADHRGRLRVRANRRAGRKSPLLRKYLRGCTLLGKKSLKKQTGENILPNMRCAKTQKRTRSLKSRSWETLTRLNQAIYNNIDPSVWINPLVDSSSISTMSDSYDPFSLDAVIMRETLLKLDELDGNFDGRIRLTTLSSLTSVQALEVAEHIVLIAGLDNEEESGLSVDWIAKQILMMKRVMRIARHDRDDYIEIPTDLYSENDLMSAGLAAMDATLGR